MKARAVMILALFLVGCRQMPALPAITTPYKMDIQQGNLVTQEMISKLQPGMTRNQVRFALGTPLVVDPFRTDRWDYVFLYQKAGVVTEHRKIAVIFKDDKLLRIEGDVVPAAPGSAAPAGAKADKPPAATDKPGPVPPVASTGAGQEGEQGKPPAEKPVAEKPAAEKPAEEPGFFGRMLEMLGF
ncbi:MAG: hypothetical protein A3I02_16475 [Betaproteobacteria bacterium RIFCSPLOWO2_02_FULL_67_26]|nr:MAG: hypothetical protein A3I02_16475 [Betaproteobacteria bacterium RIFCSPLOWO2_02_FULL_67_26]